MLDKEFKYKQLTRKCPTSTSKRGIAVGCLTADDIQNQKLGEFLNDSAIFSHEICMDLCLSHFGSRYAAFNLDEVEKIDDKGRLTCACFIDLPEPMKELRTVSCDAQEAESTWHVFTTGFLDKPETQIFSRTTRTPREVSEFYTYHTNPSHKSMAHLPRIVFFLIVNERQYERQIYRLLNVIYDKYHYYYIHVDLVRWLV